MRHLKILFILKKRHLYNTPSYGKTMHSGLYNSAHFVNDMLNKNGIESELIQVIDNNDIDREVTKRNPTHVIIEALWIVPKKFEILHKLHPNVNWIVRLHSEMPFLANESIAMKWLFEYSKLSENFNIKIAPNTPKMFNDLKSIGIKNLIFLPNYYPIHHNREDECHNTYNKEKRHVDIGCFGAIRPMKNQLIQATAAIEFGNKIGKVIHFHVNVERLERGDSAMENIRALFRNQPIHRLIEHPWYNHEEFMHLLSKMDLGLQVSFNETFNIVAADFVSKNIPVIGSYEISWLHCLYKAKATSSRDIVNKMRIAYFLKDYNFQKLNKLNLFEVSEKAKFIWIKYFKGC